MSVKPLSRSIARGTAREALNIIDNLSPDAALLDANLGEPTFKCWLSIGTRSTQSIRASGHARRTDRPNT